MYKRQPPSKTIYAPKTRRPFVLPALLLPFSFLVPVISPENEMFAYDIKQTEPNFSIARNLKIEPFEVKESYEVYLGGLAREEYGFEKAF